MSGIGKHPHPRKSAQRLLDGGWVAGSIEAWYRQVRRHHPEEAEAYLLPVVRQAKILENRRMKEAGRGE